MSSLSAPLPLEGKLGGGVMDDVSTSTFCLHESMLPSSISFVPFAWSMLHKMDSSSNHQPLAPLPLSQSGVMDVSTTDGQVSTQPTHFHLATESTSCFASTKVELNFASS